MNAAWVRLCNVQAADKVLTFPSHVIFGRPDDLIMTSRWINDVSFEDSFSAERREGRTAKLSERAGAACVA